MFLCAAGKARGRGVCIAGSQPPPPASSSWDPSTFVLAKRAFKHLVKTKFESFKVRFSVCVSWHPLLYS